jgi:hypothetical protein
MKVTALIPDNIVNDVKQYAGGKNLTECLIVALEDWISLKKIKELNQKIKSNPLKFTENFSSDTIRELNRKG